MKHYNFFATSYAGFEDEVLRVRNTNRSIAQTHKYLEWRYAKSIDLPEPLVFWIRATSGEAVGMASMIFRRYWMNNNPIYLGVIGDISLNADLRGKGLGKQLLEYIKQYLVINMPDMAAFVIPNEAARRSLMSAGWEFGGKFVPYVLPFRPAEKLLLAFGNGYLANHVAELIKSLISLLARLHIRKGYTMQLVDKLDDSFGALWNAISKDNLILSDRGCEALTWRYVKHPNDKFGIAKLHKKGELVGYLIFTSSELDRTFYIYDLIVKDRKDLLRMLALFVIQLIQYSGFNAIRLVLNDKHPYCGNLWKLGFIRRKDQGTFYIYWPNGFAHTLTSTWALTFGDKDV